MEAVKFSSKLLSEKKINDEVKILEFEVPPNFSFEAGQYVMMAFYKDEKRILRSYSIFSPPKLKGKILIYFKKVSGGYASNKLFNMEVGEKIEMKGPLGRFKVNDFSKDIVMVSSGTGYSPLRSMVLDLKERDYNGKVMLIRGYRDEKGVVLDEELRGVNLKSHLVLSQPLSESYKFKGHVQDFLEELIPKSFNGDFYICGLKDMILLVREKLKLMGIPSERIFYEKYD